MDPVTDWLRRHVAHRQLVILLAVMAGLGIFIYFFGDELAPVFAAIVIAYLLQGAINRLVGYGVPRRIAFWLVFFLGLLGAGVVLFGMLPLLFHEVSGLIQQVPNMMSAAKRVLGQLPNQYPDLVTVDQVNQITADLSSQILHLGQRLLSYSFTSALTIITILVYLILVPFLVFFLVKDKDKIVDWLLGFLPSDRSLTNEVWREVDILIDKYIQGKVWEIIIVGGVTYAAFLVLGLQYSLLLAAITGFSVLIPYIGATVVTLPVAFVAYYQFGWSAELAYVVVSYLVIQALDGNLLVPILFGEVVNLHPVAIIVAVLFFGGIWGFWGVFFAIPLATVISSVISAWPDLTEIAGDAADEPESDTETSTGDA